MQSYMTCYSPDTRTDETYKESWTGWASLVFTDVAKYSLYNNIWGAGSINPYKQCIFGNGPTCWNSGWKWDWPEDGRPNDVKAYPEIKVSAASYTMLPTQISAQKNIYVKWIFNVTGYDGTGLPTGVGNCSWDMWVAATPTGAHTYEVMFWPYFWGAAGTFGTKIATVTIAGHTCDLYRAILRRGRGSILRFDGLAVPWTVVTSPVFPFAFSFSRTAWSQPP
jgi:hypothetical protein